MMTVDLLRELYVHLEWADDLVWEAIMAADLEPTDAYLLSTIHHLHATQRAFMNFWTGAEIERPDPDRFSDLGEIRAWSKAFYEEAEVFLMSLEDDDLQRDAVVPWVRYFERYMGQPAGVTSLGETIFQVAVHSAYHRGQVNRRLRELGGEPPLVDFIAWVWLNRPRSPRKR